jgi:hypothetical protein
LLQLSCESFISLPRVWSLDSSLPGD